MNNNQTPNNFVNNVVDETTQMDPQDIESNKVISLFSYLGILFLIPLLAAKDSKYARFHANQGLVLFLAEIVVNIVGIILAFIPIIGAILLFVLEIIVLVLVIMGIVNSITGKAKELPIIGKIKIIK